LSFLLLSKDLFTICQSNCFQSTCSHIVSLTAFKGLVHKLSVLLLPKDLFPKCQSYCFKRTCSQIVSLTAFKGLVHTCQSCSFQRTCSHIGSGHEVPLIPLVLVLLFGSFNVSKQIELYKELYTPWKSGHEESPNFQSLFKSL
jgi:hypothetical protein